MYNKLINNSLVKKLVFLVLAIPLFFSGCSEEDEKPKVFYTEKQEKVFALFNGTWIDRIYTNSPTKIVFGEHNVEPVKVYRDDYLNGQVWLFDNQGECTIYNWSSYLEIYEPIECYYEVSKEADELRLYRKENNLLYRKYEMRIISETEISLLHDSLTFPYIFEKQE